MFGSQPRIGLFEVCKSLNACPHCDQPGLRMGPVEGFYISEISTKMRLASHTHGSVIPWNTLNFMIYGIKHPTTDTVLSRFQQECPEVNQESGCFRNQNASHISLYDAERSSSVLSLNCCSPLCWESGFSWKYSAPARTADHW